MLSLRKITWLAPMLMIVVFTACAPVAAPAPLVQGKEEPRVNDSQTHLPDQPAEPTQAPQVCPTCAAGTASYPPIPEGFGILGDSFYDEYQADNHRGGDYHATTFNLVEILVHTRHINVGPWGTRDEPRRTGFAYNWARSGATSTSMIEQGQHTGLAEQIRQGKVAFVWIGIGANDFNPYFGSVYQEIYDGTMTDRQLQEKIDTAIANVTLAVDTVLEAGAKGVIVTYFTQNELDPFLGQRFPEKDRRQRIARSIEAVNRGIQTMADARGIYTFNQNAISEKLLPGLVENRYLVVGGQRIDFAECGDEPQYSRLGDVQHLGTVLSGLSTNLYFIEMFNEKYGWNIAPLSDEEILRIAGFWEE